MIMMMIKKTYENRKPSIDHSQSKHVFQIKTKEPISKELIQNGYSRWIKKNNNRAYDILQQPQERR